MSTRTFSRDELDAMRLPKCWHPSWKTERREGEAEAVLTEHIESDRWSNLMRLIFRAPDDGKCYEVYYREGATEYQEGTDPWDDDPNVTVTEVEQVQVVRTEWQKVER